MPQILFPEFREQNLDSKYPFSDGASLTSTSGLVIDPDLFIDASLYPIGSTSRLYISQIESALQTITITIGDNHSASVATADFSLQSLPEVIQFYDSYGRPAGILVADQLRLSIAQSWPPGTHKFARGATEFVASCCIPQPASGVRGLATEADDLLTGDVYLVGEDGVVVREDADGSIRIDIVGDPLFKRRICSPVDLFETPRFVKTINGIPPDAYGNFVIDVSTAEVAQPAMRIYPLDAQTLKFEIVGSTLNG